MGTVILGIESRRAHEIRPLPGPPRTRTIGGSGVSIDTTIGYNAANEITSILHQSYTPGGSGGTYSTINSYSYGYDSGGLLTTQTNNDGTFNYSYDKTNQLTGVTGPWNESFSYLCSGQYQIVDFLKIDDFKKLRAMKIGTRKAA